MSDKNLPVYSYSKNSYHICDYVKESFKIPFNESVIWMKHETKHSRIMKGINPTQNILEQNYYFGGIFTEIGIQFLISFIKFKRSRSNNLVPEIHRSPLKMEEQNERITWLQKAKQSISLLSLEPVVFLQTFTWGLASVISQNLIIDKVCR